MKSIVVLTLALLSANQTFSQANVEVLKKENTTLKSENQTLKDKIKFQDEKINFCTALNSDTSTQIISFNSKYTFKVLSCKGNRSSQSVVLELVLTQNGVNQEFYVDVSNESIAVDVLGKTYFVKTEYSSQIVVFTDTPTKITITINNVLPGMDLFKAIGLRMVTKDKGTYSGEFVMTTLKNIKVKW